MTKNPNESIKQITEEVLEEVTREMGFTESPFRCRCDPQPGENGPPTWRVAFWVTPLLGLGFEIEAEGEINSGAMRLLIKRKIEKELIRAGFEE